MRKFLTLLACVVACSAAPAFGGKVPNEGTLSVRDGKGMVQLNSRGTMIGRIARGKVTVTDPNPYDSRRPIVLGQERTSYRNARVTVYSGRDIRVRVNGGLAQVKFEGKGIHLSAVGRGHGKIAGTGNAGAGLLNDGVWSLNDEEYQSLPDFLTSFQLIGEPGGRG